MLCAVLLGIVGCGPAHETEELSPKEMQSQLQKAMPKGMKLAEARQYMEKEGFQCEMVVDGEWKKKKVPRFMKCSREDGKMIKRKWDVAVMHDGDKVVNVDLRTALVYP